MSFSFIQDRQLIVSDVYYKRPCLCVIQNINVKICLSTVLLALGIGQNLIKLGLSRFLFKARFTGLYRTVHTADSTRLCTVLKLTTANVPLTRTHNQCENNTVCTDIRVVLFMVSYNIKKYVQKRLKVQKYLTTYLKLIYSEG